MFGEVIEIMKNANAGEKMEEVATATRKSIWEEAREQGHQQGRQQGHQQGRREGRREGEQAMLLRMLGHRFGALPEDVVERVESASLERLEVLLERGLTASRLEEIFEPD